MADWVNNGSCQDMSDLAKNSIWPTSQAAGNMIASNDEAMTAPGSQPVDNLDNHQSQVHEDPTVEMSNATQIKPGTDGKPQPGDDHMPSAPAWGKTTTPSVVRGK